MRHDPSSIGTLLREHRKARTLTLEQLAQRVECAKSYLSAIENGHKGPPSDQLAQRLERALGITPGLLLDKVRMERTPPDIRKSLAELGADRRTLERIRKLCSHGSLDEAFRSGELHRLIDASPPSAEPIDHALPLEVPLINRVSAGYPTDFTDLDYPARVADEYIRAPDISDPDAFAARVVGDSMEPDYLQGDVLVFSPASEPRNGDDCFVRLEPDHDTTFKRIYFETGPEGQQLIRIQPINNRYPPRTVPREQVAGLYPAISFTRSLPRG